MPQRGNAFITANCQVDSQGLGAAGLAQVLDSLLEVEPAERSGGPFPRLVRILNRIAKVNPHQHITGSVGQRSLLKRVIQVYRQDSLARKAFLDYPDKSNLAHLTEPEGW
jgi:hypothetical protein